MGRHYRLHPSLSRSSPKPGRRSVGVRVLRFRRFQPPLQHVRTPNSAQCRKLNLSATVQETRGMVVDTSSAFTFENERVLDRRLRGPTSDRLTAFRTGLAWVYS